MNRVKFNKGDLVTSKDGRDTTGETTLRYSGVGEIVQRDPDDGQYKVSWPDMDGYQDWLCHTWHYAWQLEKWSE